MAPSLQTRRHRVAWSIAGFDPSTGAGVTADLMTFAAYDLFGCSAITALTAQSTLGVFGSESTSPEFLRQTLLQLERDLPAQGIKIGMLGGVEIAQEITAFLETRHAGEPNGQRHVVLDPVLRSSSGRALFPEWGIDVLRKQLLPQVGWVTPNWSELAILTDCAVDDQAAAIRAGNKLLEDQPHLHLVITGGDQLEPCDVLLSAGSEPVHFAGERIETTSTHGTGCAFSSALLGELLLGRSPGEAVAGAKRFVEGALREAPGLGGGRGPMELLWPLRECRQRTR